MEAENCVVDNCSKGEVVKQLSEVDPDIGVTVLAQAFVVEAIDLGDLTDFMVASQDGNSVLEARLQGDEESHGLNGVVATVDIISHEKVVGIWRLSANFKELFQVMELPMDVSANCDWRLDGLYVRLVDENFFSLFTQSFDLLLRERNAVKELLDLSI